MLASVVSELKDFDEEEEKGFLGIFKKSSNKLENMKLKYNKAEANINKICKVMEDHQVTLLKDAAMLDKMYELNLNYFKELSMYILAGKQKLSQARGTELTALLAKAEQSGLPEDTQAANDYAAMCERFEKKIYDLELTRTISMQMAPQIRLIQSNDTAMSEKIQSTLVNTIPLWKSQMVIAIGLNHSGEAARAQKEVTDMTNALLKKNAETLKTATIETARESERGIVDIETLTATNQTLISTLDEVLKIQEDGRAKRRSAETELLRIEDEMRQKLLSVSRASRQGGRLRQLFAEVSSASLCLCCIHKPEKPGLLCATKQHAEMGGNMNCLVRNATMKDWEAVIRIMNQVHNMHVEWRPDIYKPNSNIIPMDIFEKIVSEDTFFVAEADGIVVGIIELVFQRIGNPSLVTRNVIFIDSMAVDENYRGMGIGHLLFEKVRQIKEQKHFDGIELQVNAKNKAAYEMYSKYGFTRQAINMELL